MERKIGEIFEYNGEWYQCVEHKGCSGCAFLSHGNCGFNGDSYCISRSDSKSVIFKKLEKVGEPYIFSNMSIHNITMQRYKVFVKPIFTNNSIITTYNMVNETISIEIKNKEDMEENKTNFMEKLEALCKRYNMSDGVRTDFISEVKEIIKDKEYNFKPFNLEEAKAGKPVCTRDGRKARIICFDAESEHPIIALVTDGVQEFPYNYTKEGYYYTEDAETMADLMMLSEKKEGWVNIVRGSNGSPHMGRGIFQSKEEAENAIKAFSDNLIDTVKISWEEHLLTPITWDKCKVGDVVFCKVRGSCVTHKIYAIDSKKGYLIGNNRGYMNGWTKNVYGLAHKIN